MFAGSVRSGWLLVASLLIVACVGGDEPELPSEVAVGRAPISVTVPATRRTPFCEAMIELSDRLANGELDDAETAIIETYREISADVPIVIADDFSAVLAALEAGVPPPTDPTSPPTSSTVPSSTTGTDSTLGGSIDEGFDPRTSPVERVNDYVVFSCRNSENNPGPPPTEPGAEPTPTSG